MKYIKVKELFKISKGKKVEAIEKRSEGSIRYIQIDDLRNDDNIKFCEDKKEYIKANQDDIIIAWDGANAGTIGFGIEGAIGSTLAILRKDNKDIDSQFCGLYLSSKSKYLREKCTGATIPHINRESLEDIEIPLFSLELQKKIVEIIKISKQLMNKRKSQIEDLDELVKSRFIEMFGEFFVDEYITDLMSISDKITDGEHGTVPRIESGIQYLMARNITMNNTFDFKEVSYIEKKVHDKIFSRCNPEYNDLLIVCVGATIGKVALVPKIEPFSIARSVALVKYNRDKVNGEYLLWLFNHNYMKSQLKNSSNESAQAGLYIGKIKNLRIPIPPIKLQNQFANFVKQVDKLKFNMQVSLKEMESNFNSLMQKAFKGELFN